MFLKVLPLIRKYLNLFIALIQSLNSLLSNRPTTYRCSLPCTLSSFQDQIQLFLYCSDSIIELSTVKSTVYVSSAKDLLGILTIIMQDRFSELTPKTSRIANVGVGYHSVFMRFSFKVPMEKFVYPLIESRSSTAKANHNFRKKWCIEVLVF